MNRQLRAVWLMTTAVVLALVVYGLYRPACALAFIGDDYHWVQLAHAALHRPHLLLADLDSFYRPASTWTLALDRLLWGQAVGGYHATNLILQGLSALLLAVVARRFGVQSSIATVIAVLWAASPFTELPVVSVAIRFQNLLLISWLALLSAWPKGDLNWSRRRALVVGLFVLLAAASKESWVVTPALLWLAVWARPGRAGHRKLAFVLLGLAVLLYLGVYFAAFPSDKNYYDLSVGTLAKLPHMLAAFLYLEELLPLGFVLSWQAVAASALVLAAIGWGARRRLEGVALGVALLVFPLLPTLFVPFLPTRYTAIPYAGFLLLVGSTLQALLAKATVSVRRIALVASGIVASLMLVAGAFLVRADIEDHARVAEASERLLEEARAALPAFPLDRPVVVVRDEEENPLGAIAASPRGRAKLWYPRPADPYGLIDAPALFEWVLATDGMLVRPVYDWRESQRGVEGVVLIHRSGGFVLPALPCPDVAAAAERWLASGRRVRVARVESCRQ